MISNVTDIRNRSCPQLIDVRLHLLPSGSRYSFAAPPGDAGEPPEPLRYFLDIITQRTAQS
ncbi:MAG: hypothetical protein V4693_04790 [Pseudomonadota bacterium]